MSMDGKKKGKKALLRKAEAVAGGILVILVSVMLGMIYTDRQEKADAQAKEAAAGSREPEPEEDFISYNGKKYRYNKDIEACLCMGIDKSLPMGEMGGEGLSDANMLVCVNHESGEVKILAIPRDTMVTVKVVDDEGQLLQTARQQLTLQYAYGNTPRESCKLMVDAVSNLLYQVPVERYCSINMEALPVINDAVGGVDVAALEDITLNGVDYHAGEPVHLEGADALAYVRTRDINKAESAMDRLARQSQYIAAYLDKAGQVIRQDPSLAAEVFEGLDDNMCSNITADDLDELVSVMADSGTGMGGGAMLTVPGEVVMGEKLEEFHVDEDALKELVVQTFYIEMTEEKD